MQKINTFGKIFICGKIAVKGIFRLKKLAIRSLFYYNTSLT